MNVRDMMCYRSFADYVIKSINAEGTEMPNVELHGFGVESGDDTIQSIQKIFTGTPWQDDYVTTNVLSDVRDHYGHKKPYFRVFGTKQSEIDALATILVRLGYDIELMPPITFLPKKK